MSEEKDKHVLVSQVWKKLHFLAFVIDHRIAKDLTSGWGEPAFLEIFAVSSPEYVFMYVCVYVCVFMCTSAYVFMCICVCLYV